MHNEVGKADEAMSCKVGGSVRKLCTGALLGAVMASPLFLSGEAMAKLDYTYRIDTVTVNGGEWGHQFDGTYDLEKEYLPGVVDCENGTASYEALKAQAVAARTYAYYKLMTSSSGEIQNGQSHQVFRTPNNPSPEQKHKDAVNATAGEILTFNGKYICSFYVAGSKPKTLPLSPSDETEKVISWAYPTEKYVTYNYPDNNWDSNNQGSTLGSLSNPINRGCMSQNGANYLAGMGLNYIDILKYYYGGDVQLESVLTKTWTDQEAFGIRALADFESNSWRNNASKENVFGWSPFFSSSSKNLGDGTKAEYYDAPWNEDEDWQDPNCHSGGGAQLITIDYDESAPDSYDGYFFRHVAGSQNVKTNMVASTTSNVILESTGSVGVWLKTDADDVSVSIALDDKDWSNSADLATGDRGVKFDVIGDGEWHKYEWYLDDAEYWEAWTGGGDGEIGTRFSLDSIHFFGNSDAEIYMDDVFYDMSADPVPIPEPTSLLVFGGLASLMLRRRR
ncbi:hypothetical protein JD969_07690 [Planctomycetota bacterium]|nr:hypothetical protein JD969_07690 [Planctomycetota bacterium]